MPRLRLLRNESRRVAMVSMHTSPLAAPGVGDAGGMNVYIDSVARSLAGIGVEVDVYARASEPGERGTVEAADGYRVHHLGPGIPVAKDDLPRYLPGFTADLLRHGAGRRFDAIHTHYWLSGQAGLVAAAQWGVPWVHSMHTLARVKNAFLAEGELPEPAARIVGEDQVVAEADLLVANTAAEAAELRLRYGADPDAVRVIHPGVDLDRFRPGDRSAARRRLGLPQDKVVLLFVGRLQPLKAPDVLLRSVAELVRADPGMARRLLVVVCGGPSGSAAFTTGALGALASELGIAPLVRFEPPADRTELVHWYRAADATVVPSFNESFGLVAVESQACGTPVLAAEVGGLPTAVPHGQGGLLVPGHDPVLWAAALRRLVLDPALRRSLGAGGARHAANFSWAATAQALRSGYTAAVDRYERVAVAG